MRDTHIEVLVEEGPDFSIPDLSIPEPPLPLAPSGRHKCRNRGPRAAARRQEPTTLHDAAAALTKAAGDDDAVAGVALEEAEGASKARLLSAPPATAVPITRVMFKAVPLRRTILRSMSCSREASSLLGSLLLY